MSRQRLGEWVSSIETSDRNDNQGSRRQLQIEMTTRDRNDNPRSQRQPEIATTTEDRCE